MSSELRILCHPPTGAGFSLASVPVVDASVQADAMAAFQEMLDDPAIGVVLMEDTFHDRLPDELRRRISRRAIPLVVPFPGPQLTEPANAAEAYIVELLRQVIGYRVRLR